MLTVNTAATASQRVAVDTFDGFNMGMTCLLSAVNVADAAVGGGRELRGHSRASSSGRPRHEGRRRTRRPAMAMDARLRAPRRPHADARLRADARGCDGGVC